MKRRNFTLSINTDIEQVIEAAEKYPLWAWIIHDQDINKETGELIAPHAHIYLECPNPRSFKSVAESLQIPENMIEKVIDKNGILQYLIHKNQPDKHQYDFEEIHSNFDLTPFFLTKSTNTLWYDFLKLKRHQLSPQEFYDIHQSEIESNGFYQKLKIFDMISSYTSPTEGNSFPPIHSLIK